MSHTKQQIMEQAQVFASAWSLVGGPFDAGNELDNAQAMKEELGDMVASVTRERDGATALLLWVLYHHQGGSSHIGQPIRAFMGIGRFDHMTDLQVAIAKGAGGEVARITAGFSAATANFPHDDMGREVAA